MPTREDLLRPGDSVDLEIQGVLVRGMKVLVATRKGKCNRSEQWFNPPSLIAWKPGPALTPEQIAAIFPGVTFPGGRVWSVTVLLNRNPPTNTEEISVLEQAQQAVSQLNTSQAPSVKQVIQDFIPSKYQKIILDKLLHTAKHLFIEALAGCGKTQTLVWLVKQLKALNLTINKAIVYLAFNKSIQEELVEKLLGTGVPAMTTHGFCFTEILKKRFRELRDAEDKAVNEYRASDLFQQCLCDELGLDYSEQSIKYVRKSDRWKLRSSVSGNGGLVGFIKNWAILPYYDNKKGYWFDEGQFARMYELMEEYEIEIPEDFAAEDIVKYAAEVVIRGIPLPGEKLDRVDYDDMLYLPLALNLPFPKFHLVLTDESQDFNAAQEMILAKLIGEDFGRAVVVGDFFQSIYRFRGADHNAFYNIRRMLENTKKGVEVCDLPINYRSDVAIINHARQWVPKLEGRGKELGQQEGEVKEDTLFGQALQLANNDATNDNAKPQFCFLCRVTVPVVVTAYQLIGMGKKVSIIGRKTIALPLLTIINEICGTVHKKSGAFPDWGTKRISDERDEQGRVTEEGLLTRLRNYRDVQFRKLEGDKFAKKREDLENNCDCIELICNRVVDGKIDDSVETVRKEISSLFVEKPDDRGVILLSTVHRSKGLEWDTVFILRPDLMPHPLAHTEEELIEERNIAYVAATRAKHSLHYICNWPFGRGKGGVLRAPGLTDEQVEQEKARGTDNLVGEMIEAEGEVCVPRRTPVVVPPRRVIAHTDRPLTTEQMVSELDKVSRPTAQKSVPLEHPIDYTKKFVDDGEPF